MMLSHHTLAGRCPSHLPAVPTSRVHGPAGTLIAGDGSGAGVPDCCAERGAGPGDRSSKEMGHGGHGNGLPVQDAGQESKGPSWAAVEGRLAVCRVGRGAPRFAPRAERNDSAPRAWLVSIAS